MKPLDKFMVETYELLMKYWRYVAQKVKETCVAKVGKCKVFVIGSVARGTATALSDLDVLVIIPKGLNPYEIKKELLREVIKHIPLDYPLNLHVVNEGEEGKYLKRGYVRI